MTMAEPRSPAPALSRRAILAGGGSTEAMRSANRQREDNALVRLLSGPMAPYKRPRRTADSGHRHFTAWTGAAAVVTIARGRGGFAWLSTLRALERRLLVVHRGGAFHLTDEGRALAVAIHRERAGNA
jgi:hypothetical protein